MISPTSILHSLSSALRSLIFYYFFNVLITHNLKSYVIVFLYDTFEIFYVNNIFLYKCNFYLFMSYLYDSFQ
jgi:flagellar biosynthesis protein FliR